MARDVRRVHRTTLMAVLVAMAPSVPHAHATTPFTTPFERGKGSSRGGAVAPAPAPAPLGDVPANRHSGGDGTGAARVGRAMYEFMTLCHARGWVMAPSDSDDDRYVVSTGASAAAADQDEEERDRKGEGQEKCRRRRLTRHHRTALVSTPGLYS